MGSAMVPAAYEEKNRVATEAGALIMDVLERGLKPRDIITREGLENAIAAVATSGGSTNGVLHLLALAREAGVPLEIDDFDRIAAEVPTTCDLKPGGRFLAKDLYDAGGIGVVAKRLLEAGRLHEDVPTVTGKTIGQHAREAQETPGQEVVRPVDDPVKKTGGLAILRGNLAPEGSVVKLSGHERVHHSGPARVFECEEDAMRAVTAGGDQGRRRRRDPQRGPRRRPRHARDAGGHRGARRPGPGGGGRAAHRRPLLRRHPRLHGRPRRARGAVRAARSRPSGTATRSRSTSPSRRMDVELADEEIARRVAAYDEPAARVRARRAREVREARLERLRGRGHEAVARAIPGTPASGASSPARNPRSSSLKRDGRSSIGTWPVSSKTTTRAFGPISAA